MFVWNKYCKGVKSMCECIFCKIVSGEIPCSKIYEDDSVLCFNDINPEAPCHVIIIPKKHIRSLNELDADDADLIGHIFMVAKEVAKKLNIEKDGYRIVNNCGINGGQSVNHMHFHLLGGRMMKWPPG